MRTEPEPDWHEDAACLNYPPELFFPEGRGSSVRDALTVCKEKCKVRAQCLEEALKYPAQEQYGVAGGLAEHERRALIRRRGRVA